MTRRLALIFAACLTAAPVQAQFQLPDMKSGKDGQLDLGGIIGQVKDLAGGQSTDDEARSGDAIAATVFTVLGARNPHSDTPVDAARP